MAYDHHKWSEKFRGIDQLPEWDGWELIIGDDRFPTLKNKDGRAIGFYEAKGRIEVVGYLKMEGNKCTAYELGIKSSNLPKVTIAATKTLQEITRDVHRRFMPEYNAMYKLFLEKAIQQVDEEIRIELLKADITKRFNATTHSGTREFHRYTDNLHINGKVLWGLSVNVDLHGLTAEQALKLADFLRDL